MRALILCLFVLAASLVCAQDDTKYAKYFALLEAIGNRRESLVSAAVLHDPEKWYAQSYMVPTRAEDKQKFREDLAYIEKLITSDYASVVAPPSYSPRNVLEHPEAWLEIVRAREAILAKVGGAQAADKATAEVKFIKDITAAIRSHDGWGLTENGLKIVMGKREDVRSKLCDGEKYPGWDQACDELVKAAKELAPKVRSYANYSNSWITDLIKSGWAKNYKDRTILKIATAKSDWTVVKGPTGVPKYRSMGVAVRYKVPGFDYVIEQTISILQDYVGGGQYKYRPTSQMSDYRIVTGK